MISTGYSEVIPPMVSAFTVGWVDYAHERVANVPPASGAWVGNNEAVYHPILVRTTCVVRRLWWANGSTVSASYNVDCGIYADAGYVPGVKIISTGSTAQGTASEVQFVNVTDTTLAPGRYWLALVSSSSSATFFRTTIAGLGAQIALYSFTESSALPLPTTATPVESANWYFWLFGFATTASP